MTIKYHIANGVLAPCNAKVKACPLSPEENHIYMDKEITTPEEMWEVFDKKIDSRKQVENLKRKYSAQLQSEPDSSEFSDDIADEIADEIVYNEELSGEQKKALLDAVFNETRHPRVVLYAIVRSRLYTTKEVDKKFFSLTPAAQSQSLHTVFGDWNWTKYKRTEEELRQYLPAVARLINSSDLESGSSYAIGDYVRSVAKWSKDDETLAQVAYTLDNVNAYTSEYCNGYHQDELISNPHCSPETAEIVLTNLVRAGNVRSFLTSTATVTERLDGGLPDKDKRVEALQRVIKRFEAQNVGNGFNGEPDEKVTQFVTKKLNASTTQADLYNTYGSHRNMFNVYDAYKGNLDALQKAPKKLSNDIFEQHMYEKCQELRLAEAKGYLKAVSLYWQVVRQLSENKNKWS